MCDAFHQLVSVALCANGVVEIWFSYWAHKSSLLRIEREQAEGAAANISQFLKDIEAQLGWTVQLPWASSSTTAQRRIDASRLLRQVQAISELEQIDPSGLVQLRVSRTEPDEVGSVTSVANEPKFREAMAHTAYYGPVYFKQNAEPYMTLALAGSERNPASVSLKSTEGTVERFAGDGLLVPFNDPLPCPDPCERAAQMAIEMRDDVARLCGPRAFLRS